MSRYLKFSTIIRSEASMSASVSIRDLPSGDTARPNIGQCAAEEGPLGSALLWISYGVMIHAGPVIVANLIVAVLAISSSFRPAAGAVARPSATREPLATDEG